MILYESAGMPNSNFWFLLGLFKVSGEYTMLTELLSFRLLQDIANNNTNKERQPFSIIKDKTDLILNLEIKSG